MGGAHGGVVVGPTSVTPAATGAALPEDPDAVLEAAVDVLEPVTSLEPEFLLALAGTVVVLVFLLWFWRWYRRPPGVRLASLLKQREAITVLMHPNPDPDAMASAMGVAAIARSVGTDATMQYPGKIKHQENRAFKNVLEVDLERIEGRGDLATDDVVLVDHNTPRGFDGDQGIEPIAVIDHHSGNGTGTDLTDVRPEYGATATIITEYLRTLGAETDGEERPEFENRQEPTPLLVTPVLATGLLYGIHSDTNRLTVGVTSEDFDACAYLFPLVDQDLLERIANPRVSGEVLEVKARAIENRRIKGSLAVCDVGEISNADAIPQAADELLLLEEVSAVVVYGRDGDTIYLSGRSDDDRVHIGDVLEEAVADIPMASGGGHLEMGGAQISIPHLRGIGPSEGYTDEELQDRLFSAMAGDL